MKFKAEREGYTQLNADFQRIAGRDKTVFLNEQCNEIKENNTMGKMKNLFMIIRYQGNVLCKNRHTKG